MYKYKSSIISNKEAYPIIEGGKGVAVSNGVTAGNFALNGAVGTISVVLPDYSDDITGNQYLMDYSKLTRLERHNKMIQLAIEGGIKQIKTARDICGKNGVIHINMLWEAGGAIKILNGILDKVSTLIDGITCGAGMPYLLSEMASSHKNYYYPIVSSMRAFSILWKRKYSNFSKYLGGVVYEDPWLAGGHNGLSSKEDPSVVESPYERIVAIRTFLNSVGLHHIPIIMAGGVWSIKEWESYIDNPEIGNIAFQFGTRPLITQESPISDDWKKFIISNKDCDVRLNTFSPTGFYSSAINNTFLQTLYERSVRQVKYARRLNDEYSELIVSKNKISKCYIKLKDKEKVLSWMNNGFDVFLKTPDNTVVFETEAVAAEILRDQQNCIGCLSQCRFSSWKDHSNENGHYSTGRKSDPRSFCIQKTLSDIAHGADIDTNLMFAGQIAKRFYNDPLYNKNNEKYIPTIKELIHHLMTGM